MPQKDPFLEPNFSLQNRALRLLWGITYILLFRYSPRPFHAWRSFLLRCFGAAIGKQCHIYPKATIWAPWNLICEDVATIADEAIIYNVASVFLGSHAIVSQQAYLCSASHDYQNPNFPLIAAPIRIGAYAWVCARATVQMGVTLGEGAVLGLGAIATKNLESWSVYAGIPAIKIKQRQYQQLDEP
jgi:putative colanic acid biosynthesis acetyltransferase WcaF